MNIEATVEIVIAENVAQWLSATSASFGQSIPEAIAAIIQEAYESHIAEAVANQVFADGRDNANGGGYPSLVDVIGGSIVMGPIPEREMLPPWKLEH